MGSKKGTEAYRIGMMAKLASSRGWREVQTYLSVLRRPRQEDCNSRTAWATE